uniref:Glycerophosphocholine phosphodiesterase GPCPD1-like n=1 Tax=Hirondellea gigas TaxID=1518452 RepID=A0A2P2I1B8_9CRUS
MLMEDTTEHGDTSRPALQPVSWPLMEVAVLKEGKCRFAPLKQFGVAFDEENFTMFQCRMLDHTTTAYLFDYYLEATAPDEIPHYIGCSYLLPSNLVENFGVATIPITSPRHLPIGQLTVHYMVVKPMQSAMSDMSVSFTRYWKDSWKGLQVGHRGAGNSYHSQPKSCANIRENTVASFKYAAESGADMVEIDVQLSRDFVPVIYHDFHACIALTRKKDQEHSDLLEIPIKDLTLQQLQALKVYHKKEKGLNKFSDEEFEDHQPFPTLEKALKNVPSTCGFNVEVKWTMQMKDGSYELMHPFELNNFMDIILKVVLEHGGGRKIVFSCFHPDICSMLRLKQNRYPVLFLTQGASEHWSPYDDMRCQSIRLAVLYATTADILGINLHTEDLLRDASQMELALQNNLIVFCWGDLNNDKSNIAFLKKLGMHAIIYDKIDVYNSKTEKESIFLCEERQSLEQQTVSRNETTTITTTTTTTTGNDAEMTVANNNINDISSGSFVNIGSIVKQSSNTAVCSFRPFMSNIFAPIVTSSFDNIGSSSGVVQSSNSGLESGGNSCAVESLNNRPTGLGDASTSLQDNLSFSFMLARAKEIN